MAGERLGVGEVAFWHDYRPGVGPNCQVLVVHRCRVLSVGDRRTWVVPGFSDDTPQLPPALLDNDRLLTYTESNQRVKDFLLGNTMSHYEGSLCETLVVEHAWEGEVLRVFATGSRPAAGGT